LAWITVLPKVPLYRRHILAVAAGPGGDRKKREILVVKAILADQLSLPP
jgi:hypothetical protein